jgi:hypothetical protein
MLLFALAFVPMTELLLFGLAFELAFKLRFAFLMTCKLETFLSMLLQRFISSTTNDFTML